MFKLVGASVHYGSSSYPLNGLPSHYDLISGIDDPVLTSLTGDVGHITGFPRSFEFRHHAELDLVKLAVAGGYDKDLPADAPKVIPERIVAVANGYTITWYKE